MSNKNREHKTQEQIEIIENRISEKNIGRTGSLDVLLLTTIKMGEEIAEQTRLLRKIAKMPEEPLKKPWYKKLGL